MGFFTWSVPDNLLFADEVFGNIYEFSHEELRRGLSVEAILGRIAIEHREGIAERLHATILSGAPSAIRYDVACPTGIQKSVIAFGRCLHDFDRIPSFYTGAVMLASQETLVVGSNAIEGHCRAALAIARDEGRELTARYLSSALRSLGSDCA
jgi:hypothetical protein